MTSVFETKIAKVKTALENVFLKKNIGSTNGGKSLVTDSNGNITVENKNNHSHGDITSDGKITATAGYASANDKILVADGSDGKIKRRHDILSNQVTDYGAYVNFSTNGESTQSTINIEIDTILSDKADSNHSHNISDLTDDVLGSLAYENDVDLTTHDVSELTDNYDTAFTPKSHTHTVSNITDFPSTMTPSSHTHGNIKNDGTFNGVHVVDTYNMNVVTDNHGVISLEDKYTHPNDLGSTKTSGLYKIALNDKGHVTSATSIEKSDITGLGIPASDTTYSLADGTTNGLSSNDFTSAEKTKLSGIATGANNYTHPASHGNITSDGKCSTTGTVDVSRGDLLLFADATSGANQYTIKGSTFVDALNDLILDLIDEGES